MLGRRWPDPNNRGVPYWLPEDVATALAWRSHEARRCQRCGTHPLEWSEDERDDPTFAAFALRCRGCATIAQYRREMPDEADAEGVDIRLRPFDPDRELDEALAEDERRFAQYMGPYAPPEQLIAPAGPAESPAVGPEPPAG